MKKPPSKKPKKSKAAKGTIELIKSHIEELVADVVESASLVDSPVRLVASEGGLDFNLERISIRNKWISMKLGSWGCHWGRGAVGP